MSEYIKREDAYREIMECFKNSDMPEEWGHGMHTAGMIVLQDVPSADVVEVVRCKDCKRGGWRVSGLDNKTKGYRCAIHAVLGVDFGDNGYCSYGERKEK